MNNDELDKLRLQAIGKLYDETWMGGGDDDISMSSAVNIITDLIADVKNHYGNKNVSPIREDMLIKSHELVGPLVEYKFISNPFSTIGSIDLMIRETSDIMNAKISAEVKKHGGHSAIRSAFEIVSDGSPHGIDNTTVIRCRIKILDKRGVDLQIRGGDPTI